RASISPNAAPTLPNTTTAWPEKNSNTEKQVGQNSVLPVCRVSDPAPKTNPLTPTHSSLATPHPPPLVGTARCAVLRLPPNPPTKPPRIMPTQPMVSKTPTTSPNTTSAP